MPEYENFDNFPLIYRFYFDNFPSILTSRVILAPQARLIFGLFDVVWQFCAAGAPHFWHLTPCHTLAGDVMRYIFDVTRYIFDVTRYIFDVTRYIFDVTRYIQNRFSPPILG